MYPNSYNLDNIITVMAIDNKGESYVAGGYGRKSVDIAAPGVGVKVTLPENDETYIDGTSIATAYVSGAAALMLSENELLTPQSIKKIIIDSAKQLDSLSGLCIAEGMIDTYQCIVQLKAIK